MDHSMVINTSYISFFQAIVMCHRIYCKSLFDTIWYQISKKSQLYFFVITAASRYHGRQNGHVLSIQICKNYYFGHIKVHPD